MRIELTTSSLPRKCSTPELQQHERKLKCKINNTIPTCFPISYRAGDEVRTRDLQLGRLSLYQLSYSRIFCSSPAEANYLNISKEQFLTQLSSAPGKQKRNKNRGCGQDRIRTYEVVDSGFTVRPIWPLWNLPLKPLSCFSLISRSITLLPNSVRIPEI
jgi:hypothetical protein